MKSQPRGALGARGLLLALLVVTQPVLATATEEAPAVTAAALYDRGASAYDSGRFEEALSTLARAEALLPNDVTLELALRAALRTSQAPEAMALAERATGRGERVIAVARLVRRKFEQRVGTLRVLCGNCEARLAGQQLEPGASRLVEVGQHELWISSGPSSRVYPIRIDPAQQLDFRLESSTVAAPSRRDPAPEAGRVARVSPAWMWLAAGVSTALSAATIVSAIDTRARYERFRNEPDEAHARAGMSSQARTNWLLGGTLLSVGTTVVLGVFVVEWDTPR